jgi:hypothetical protein
MRNKNNAKQLPDDINKEIEKIIDELKCPKDFICYKSGFRNLCKVEDIGKVGIIVSITPQVIKRKTAELPKEFV